MQNVNGVQTQYKGGRLNRQRRALSRLENQLKTGIKPYKGGVSGVNPDPGVVFIQLEDKDVKRIQKEISIIKSKI